ncbi:MAG TPA: diguanylate cyclase [Noviherbaspirillum sp.]|jgi:diguanylate cyclase|uniref:GGDEF domain-containing protein n=1 Tax=Noviherbaspirillum sp. TaxID=1926288 RepID=UPI002DDD527A|nr:diguanylate cyclase [Noviherbaspirillum sp.]HEV2608667.1 diguanylate cyclase [Noviherbaspirillum sp.]
MQEKEKPAGQSPADIAREAFRRLGARRIAPTPDAYRQVYEEVAGQVPQPGAEQMLASVAATLSEVSTAADELVRRFTRSIEGRNWAETNRELNLLIAEYLKRGPQNTAAQLPAPVPPPSAASETEAPVPRRTGFSFSDDNQTRMLRDLLTRTLTLAVSSLLQGAPELARESEALAESIKVARTEQALQDVSVRLKQLCFKIELKSGDMAEEHELLLRLFNLLLENVSELLEDDSWLSGQIAGVQNLLAGPISHGALMDATRSLKEVIYKQGLLKHSLAEAKVTVKTMMLTFIDQLALIAASTGDYHKKIDEYSQKIGKASDITELNRILDDVMRDTRTAQTEALRSRDEMMSVRKEVQEAEARINDLETKLRQMSELVMEDQLTGSLNRRGLDDVFSRELARADRRKSPLCIALLDLDDFKRLNDTHGHSAGDQALIHLVRVIKDTLRTMDMIARFGGEEFLIVLPDTQLDDAMQTVTRLQRELTKRIFMYNHERLLITFSAGVAIYITGEEQATLIQRADAALYQAKKAGKNRVIAAK